MSSGRPQLLLTRPLPPGVVVFAVGFADADYGELLNVASRPSSRHVFFVDHLDAFTEIEEELLTLVCEAASASELPRLRRLPALGWSRDC